MHLFDFYIFSMPMNSLNPKESNLPKPKWFLLYLHQALHCDSSILEAIYLSFPSSLRFFIDVFGMENKPLNLKEAFLKVMGKYKGFGKSRVIGEDLFSCRIYPDIRFSIMYDVLPAHQSFYLIFQNAKGWWSLRHECPNICECRCDTWHVGTLSNDDDLCLEVPNRKSIPEYLASLEHSVAFRTAGKCLISNSNFWLTFN